MLTGSHPENAMVRPSGDHAGSIPRHPAGSSRRLPVPSCADHAQLLLQIAELATDVHEPRPIRAPRHRPVHVPARALRQRPLVRAVRVHDVELGDSALTRHRVPGGHECDSACVGRPGGKGIFSVRVGEHPAAGAIRTHDVDLDARRRRELAEDEPLARRYVGRPDAITAGSAEEQGERNAQSDA